MLYKYLPPDRIDVIELLKIRFSPLTSLNDPYEEFPLLTPSDQMDKVSKSLIRELNALWENADEHEKNEDALKEFIEAKESFIKNSKEVHPEMLIEYLGDTFGVLSLSRTNQSLLMWSHYAQSNSGIVIGFDREHDFLNEFNLLGEKTNPLVVKYSDVRKKIKLPDKGEDSDSRQEILTNKPLEWAYEQEERITRPFMNIHDEQKLDSFGNRIILQDVPADAIKEIYIGLKVNAKTKNRVLAAVIKNKIECKIYQSKLSYSSYKIEFKEILT